MADVTPARIAEKLVKVDAVWLARLEQTFPPDALERLTFAEYDYYSTHGDYLPGLAKLALHYHAELASARAQLEQRDEALRAARRERDEVYAVNAASANDRARTLEAVVEEIVALCEPERIPLPLLNSRILRVIRAAVPAARTPEGDDGREPCEACGGTGGNTAEAHLTCGSCAGTGMYPPPAREAVSADTPEQSCGHPWEAFNSEEGVCVECEMAGGSEDVGT